VRETRIDSMTKRAIYSDIMSKFTNFW